LIDRAWATVFGDQPQILVAQWRYFAARNQILDSAEWKSLNNQLQDFVRNKRSKWWEARKGLILTGGLV
jgi:hypothetical protein